MTEARNAFLAIVTGALAGQVDADRIMPTGSVDTPSGDAPFVIIKWEESTAVFGSVGPTNVDIWFYDFQRTYSRIAPMMMACKNALIEAEHVSGTDGFALTSAKWLGDSPDLYDDMYKAVLRRATYRVSARYTGT